MPTFHTWILIQWIKLFDWGLQGGYIMTVRLLAGKEALKLNGCICFSGQSQQRYCAPTYFTQIDIRSSNPYHLITSLALEDQFLNFCQHLLCSAVQTVHLIQLDSAILG